MVSLFSFFGQLGLGLALYVSMTACQFQLEFGYVGFLLLGTDPAWRVAQGMRGGSGSGSVD